MLELGFDRRMLWKAIRAMLGFLKLRLKPEEFLKSVASRIEGSVDKWKYIRDSTNHYIPVDLRPSWDIFMRSLGDKIESLVLR